MTIVREIGNRQVESEVLELGNTVEGEVLELGV